MTDIALAGPAPAREKDRMQPFLDLVLATDAAWGIGKDGGLPWPKLPADLRHFKEITSAAPEGKRNAVLMGRRTWESKEVACRPLPRRLNLVLTRRPLEVPAGVLVVSAAQQAGEPANGGAGEPANGGADERANEAPNQQTIAPANSPVSGQAAGEGLGDVLDNVLDRALARLAEPEHARTLGAVFVIGGAEIYRLALAHPRCRYIYLTRIAGTYACDTFVPALDELCEPDPSWPAAQHLDNGVALRIERLRLR